MWQPSNLDCLNLNRAKIHSLKYSEILPNEVVMVKISVFF